MKQMLCSVGAAVAMELVIKLSMRKTTVAASQSPVMMLFGALAFIAAVANLLYKPSYRTTCVQ